MKLARQRCLAWGRTIAPAWACFASFIAGCDQHAATVPPALDVETASPMNLVPESSKEEYQSLPENCFVNVEQESKSSFSVDVDTASYANIRRILLEGRLPPTSAVRIEELINYFPYDYPPPQAGQPIAVTADLAECPWQPEHWLLRVALRTRAMPDVDRPRGNFVFLLDVSGSMMEPKKLPLVKSAMVTLVEHLHPDDRVAIVVYAGDAGMALPPTLAGEAATIRAAIQQLEGGGDTNGSAGIGLAYATAHEAFIPGGINRVIWCTDGDFNVGMAPETLRDFVRSEATAGNIHLTVLGFGTGNLKDHTMEQLASLGNGSYAYIDSRNEARRRLVEQAESAFPVLASDVKVQVEFDLNSIRSYRLIGYENRLLTDSAFNNDAQDAGELGPGHTCTALYELLPTAPAPKASGTVQPGKIGGLIRVRYKQDPDGATSQIEEHFRSDQVQRCVQGDFAFLSAVAAMGLMLRDSEYAGTANWDWVVATAEENVGRDPRGLRREFVELARIARRLSGL